MVAKSIVKHGYWIILSHLELEGGSSDGVELRSVGNTLLLHETCLIEACNLKFAIEYDAKNSQFIILSLFSSLPRIYYNLWKLLTSFYQIFPFECRKLWKL